MLLPVYRKDIQQNLIFLSAMNTGRAKNLLLFMRLCQKLISSLD